MTKEPQKTVRNVLYQTVDLNFKLKISSKTQCPIAPSTAIPTFGLLLTPSPINQMNLHIERKRIVWHYQQSYRWANHDSGTPEQRNLCRIPIARHVSFTNATKNDQILFDTDPTLKMTSLITRRITICGLHGRNEKRVIDKTHRICLHVKIFPHWWRRLTIQSQRQKSHNLHGDRTRQQQEFRMNERHGVLNPIMSRVPELADLLTTWPAPCSRTFSILSPRPSRWIASPWNLFVFPWRWLPLAKTSHKASPGLP